MLGMWVILLFAIVKAIMVIFFNFFSQQSYYTKQDYKKQLYDQLKPKGGILQKRLNLTVSNAL